MNTASNFETAVSYRPAPSIRYVIEVDQTRLIDDRRGLSWSLQGLEAAIWDLLTSGHAYQRIVYSVSLLSDLPGVSAKKIVLAALQSWTDQGILEKTLDDQPDS